MDILNSEFLLFLQCAQKNNLAYLLIGGYAVNYYGYTRNTDDMDIWLKPTNENRDIFVNTLLCMGYQKQEVDALYQEDFSKHFVGSVGAEDSQIDFITIVHWNISFDEAESKKEDYIIENGPTVHIVPYELLKEMKLRSSREKDLFDIARLEELRNSPPKK